MAKTASVPARDVRAWANQNGFTLADRGRLNPDAVKAYNEAHPEAQYVEGAASKASKTVTITGNVPDKSGRNRQRSVTATPAEVRAAAERGGAQVGQKGRLSADAQQVALAVLVADRRK